MLKLLRNAASPVDAAAAAAAPVVDAQAAVVGADGKTRAPFPLGAENLTVHNVLLTICNKHAAADNDIDDNNNLITSSCKNGDSI